MSTRSIFLVALFGVSIICCRPHAEHAHHNAATAYAVPEYPFRHDQFDIPVVAAHRATTHTPGYPENALESIMALRSNGIGIIECDVRTTEDGTLILMHDASLDRTTNASGRVEDMEYKMMRDVRLRDGRQVTSFRIPKLAELLEWNRTTGEMILELDIKRGTSYEAVLELVAAYDQVANVICIVYSLDAARKMHALNDDIVLSVPIRSLTEWQRFAESSIPYDRVVGFTGTIRSDKALYDSLHYYNIPAIIGTLGNIDRQASVRGDRIYLDIVNDGADIFATDRPLHVHSLLNK